MEPAPDGAVWFRDSMGLHQPKLGVAGVGELSGNALGFEFGDHGGSETAEAAHFGARFFALEQGMHSFGAGDFDQGEKIASGHAAGLGDFGGREGSGRGEFKREEAILNMRVDLLGVEGLNNVSSFWQL